MGAVRKLHPVTTASPKQRKVAPPPPAGVEEPDWRSLGVTQADVAGAEFRRVVAILARRGDDPLDFWTILLDHCMTWAMVVECQRILAAEGLGVPGRQESTVKHPALTALTQLRANLRHTMVQLKITPKSVTPAPDDTPVEDDPFSV